MYNVVTLIVLEHGCRSCGPLLSPKRRWFCPAVQDVRAVVSTVHCVLGCVYIGNKFRQNSLVRVFSFFPQISYLTLLTKGQTFCAIDKHRVLIGGCTLPGGSVRPSCEACYTTVRDERRPVFHPAPRTVTADLVCDRTEMMDVELPGDE